jgi:hypothetical protein
MKWSLASHDRFVTVRVVWLLYAADAPSHAWDIIRHRAAADETVDYCLSLAEAETLDAMRSLESQGLRRVGQLGGTYKFCFTRKICRVSPALARIR